MKPKNTKITAIQAAIATIIINVFFIRILNYFNYPYTKLPISSPAGYIPCVISIEQVARVEPKAMPTAALCWGGALAGFAALNLPCDIHSWLRLPCNDFRMFFI